MSHEDSLHLDAFHRDGFVLLPSCLTAAECHALVAEIDEAAIDLQMPGSSRWFCSQMHLRSPVFRNLMDRSPAIDLAEQLVTFERGDAGGSAPSCHIINMSVIVARPGDGRQQFHCDDYVLFPRTADEPWDERAPYPVLLATAMYYLVDVDREMGATMVVPGSHKAGRKPDPWEPSYLGVEPRVLEVETGDCVMFHHLLWHGALEHRGSTPRYLLQVHYAARSVAPRMAPFPNHHVPATTLEALTPRQRSLIGLHSCREPYC